MSNDFEYWLEMVGESFSQNGIDYDYEKIKLVAQDMSAAHEEYGQAFYQIPSSQHPGVSASARAR
jgi:hypothetical protein